jgi:hypothetical protein
MFRYFNEKKQKFIQGKPETKYSEYQGGDVKTVHYISDSPSPNSKLSATNVNNNSNLSSSNGDHNSSGNNSANSSSGNLSQLLSESNDEHSRLPHSVKVRFESPEWSGGKGREDVPSRSHTPTKQQQQQPQQQQQQADDQANDSQSPQKLKYGGRLRRNTLIQFNYLAHENLFNYTHESHLIHEKIRSFFEVCGLSFLVSSCLPLCSLIFLTARLIS